MGIYKNFMPLTSRYDMEEKKAIDAEPIYVKMHNLARDAFNYACEHNYFMESFDRKHNRAITATLLFPAQDFDSFMEKGNLYIEITADRSEKNPRVTHVKIDVNFVRSKFYVKKEKREPLAKMSYKAFIEFNDLIMGEMCSEENFKEGFCDIKIDMPDLRYRWSSQEQSDQNPQ